VVALFCLIAGGLAGFFLGPAVQANVSEPGSSSDPLVSRSYVEEKLGDYLEDLEAELERLKTRTLELEEELKSLQQKVSSSEVPVSTILM
jgi:ABC-type phosphate transport system auxiliary subunit